MCKICDIKQFSGQGGRRYEQKTQSAVLTHLAESAQNGRHVGLRREPVLPAVPTGTDSQPSTFPGTQPSALSAAKISRWPAQLGPPFYRGTRSSKVCLRVRIISFWNLETFKMQYYFLCLYFYHTMKCLGHLFCIFKGIKPPKYHPNVLSPRPVHLSTVRSKGLKTLL